MGNPGIICLQQNLQMGIGLAPSFGVRRRTAVGRPQIQNKKKSGFVLEFQNVGAVSFNLKKNIFI